MTGVCTDRACECATCPACSARVQVVDLCEHDPPLCEADCAWEHFDGGAA